jgi:hypothetical protein
MGRLLCSFHGLREIDSDAVDRPSKHRQAISVLHQGMSHLAKLAPLALAVAIEPGVRIGRALVSLVGALLGPEVPCAIATTSRRAAAAILRTEALHRSPRLEQRPVHRKVLVGEHPLDLGLPQQRRQKILSDLARQQAVAVLSAAGIREPLTYPDLLGSNDHTRQNA